MKNRRVLISGASIAGPAIAHWLNHYGFQTTVVERSAALRKGGHAVDFRGPAHLGALERMGMLDKVKEHRTRPTDMHIVDAFGRSIVTLPAQMTAGDVEIQRGELTRLLFESTRDATEYVFSDYITSLDEHADGIDVTFARGEPRTFDLVIGADGLHSGVRALSFGEESKHVRFHGYYVAGFTSQDILHLEHTTLYSEPGKSLTVGAASATGDVGSMFLFASKPIAYDRHDEAAQKRIVAETFAGVGWETPRFIDAMMDAKDLYFDAISQVDLDHYSRGRVVLLGDAGYGGTIGGQGTGLAIVCSYILAGELARADGDYSAAFARYESQIQSYARGCQKGSERVGSFFAPTTRLGTWFRNTMYRTLTSRLFAATFEKMIRHSASSIDLGHYQLI